MDIIKIKNCPFRTVLLSNVFKAFQLVYFDITIILYKNFNTINTGVNIVKIRGS